MSVKVVLPNAFQKHTNNVKEIASTAANLPELVNDIEGAVGIPVSISLANQYEALVECSLSGTLLSNHNKLALDIKALASQVMDEAIVANRRSRMSRALTLCTAWMSA